FNEYLYNLDFGHVDALLDVFTEDATWVLVNFPPAGSGTRTELKGRQAISTWYAPTSASNTFGAGHYVTNVEVRVAKDCSSAQLKAYFHQPHYLVPRGLPRGLLGGMYDLRLVSQPDKWRIADFRDFVSWAWKPTSAESLAYGLPLETFSDAGT